MACSPATICRGECARPLCASASQRSPALSICSPTWWTPKPDRCTHHRPADAARAASYARLRAVDELHVHGEVVVEPVHQRLRRAKALRQHHPIGRAFELGVDLLVDADVGAAEAIDRLLRIADDEQFAGHQAQRRPVAFGGLRRLGRQVPGDLRLQRVGVLELVDEDPVEPRLGAARARRDGRAADRAPTSADRGKSLSPRGVRSSA